MCILYVQKFLATYIYCDAWGDSISKHVDYQKCHAPTLKVHCGLNTKYFAMKFSHCVVIIIFFIYRNPIPSFSHMNWN